MLQTIRSRMTVAFIGLAISPLLLIGVVFSVMSYSTLRQQALVEQQLQAQRVGTAVDSFVHELASQLMLLARMHDGFTSGADLEQKWFLDELLVFENRFQELSLLGPEGSVRVTRNKGEIVLGKDLKDRAGDPAFQHPFSSGQTYFGPIHLNPDSGEPLMTIGVPLQSPLSGMTVGVLLAQVRLKKIWELLASLPVREGETVFIVDDTGTVVAHPNPSVVLVGSHFDLPASLPGFADDLKNGRVALAAEQIDLGRHSLYVVAQRLESEVLALAHNTLFLISLLMLSSMATAVFLSIRAINSITRPLHELAFAARQIHEGDLSKQVEHISNDEVGELAMAFNTMTARLCRSVEEMAREIEERKRTEEALRVNEERLTLATNAGGIGIWDWDIVRNVLTWDDSMYALYSLRQEEFGGAYDAWSCMLHPDDRQSTEGEIQAALRGEREYAPEFRIIRPDGAVRHIKAFSKTYRDPQGNPTRMIGTNVDITAIKQVEDELKHHKDYLEEEVKQRTAELEKKTADLEKINKVFVGRELRMIELKKQIEELEKKVG